MINKVHFGKRIACLRKNLGLSQVELAETLGVTSQAVSKWECGNGLPDIDLLLELSRIYHISINEMLEDTDLILKLTGQKADTDGITYFGSKIEKEENGDWAKEMENGGWIKRNWESIQNTLSPRDKVGEKIASLGGIIVEIGAGPGGGYMPYILKANLDSTIIISDLSPTVVR